MFQKTSQKSVIIAGGGTGGHIYPALAIAKAIQELDSEVKIHFVGTPIGLENKIIPREGYPLHLIKVGKLNQRGGYLDKLMTLIRLPWALIKSVIILADTRPQWVLGVGGYASGPFVLMAAILGFPTAIWEPNAHPGMTNRWLSIVVDKSYAVFQEALSLLRSKNSEIVGLPVRSQIENFKKNSFKRTDSDFHVLVFGGSQGARAINSVVQEAVMTHAESSWLTGIRLIHQTGHLDFKKIQESYQNAPIQVECKEYLFDMENYYAWADLVICRAGASTVAELAACSQAAIMIPLPSAADNHQQINAESLVAHQAGLMILQKDLSVEKLISIILSLKNNPHQLELMRKNVQKFHQPNAASNLAKKLLGI